VGRWGTSGSGVEEESGFSSSIKRSEQSILNDAATVCYIVSFNFPLITYLLTPCSSQETQSLV